MVHNHYRQRGGEDVMFEAECAMLESRGVRVERLVTDNAVIREPLSVRDRLELAANTIWSSRAGRDIRRAIKRAKPDLVHAHNTFPLISPAIYAASLQAGVPIVQTLHNYRLVCPKATLFRDGQLCEDCVGRRLAVPGIIHACYQDSSERSAAVAAMLALHRARGTWQRVSAFIALSQFARDLFVEGGLPRERIFVKKNFVEPDPGDHGQDDGTFLFVGRLAEEKGLATLLRAWRILPADIHLRIIGDGPMRAMVAGAAARQPNIRFDGRADRATVIAAMQVARAAIVPSVWYEAGPLTPIEAQACGTPVIASRLGSLREYVEDGTTGLLFHASRPEDLAEKVVMLHNDAERARRLGEAGRRAYLSQYRADTNHEQLMRIYRTTLARHRGEASVRGRADGDAL
jgi:glycosyltransferase involved in cell wall biosynthesis